MQDLFFKLKITLIFCVEGYEMTANEQIIALVKPEYLKKIPKIFRKHATESTCKLIAREHADLYKVFEDGEPTESQKQEMTDLINGIFEERMKKHKMM